MVSFSFQHSNWICKIRLRMCETHNTKKNIAHNQPRPAQHLPATSHSRIISNTLIHTPPEIRQASPSTTPPTQIRDQTPPATPQSYRRHRQATPLWATPSTPFPDQAPPGTPWTTPSATPSSYTHTQPPPTTLHRHNQISAATPSHAFRPPTTPQHPPRHLPPHSAIKHHHRHSHEQQPKQHPPPHLPATSAIRHHQKHTKRHPQRPTPPCHIRDQAPHDTLDDTLPPQQTHNFRDHPPLDLLFGKKPAILLVFMAYLDLEHFNIPIDPFQLNLLSKLTAREQPKTGNAGVS